MAGSNRLAQRADASSVLIGAQSENPSVSGQHFPHEPPPRPLSARIDPVTQAHMPATDEPDNRASRPGLGNDPRYASLRETFVQAYGGDDADDNAWNDATINVVQAPGRVNLIGEHVDYNDGLVFPMAIQPRVTFAIRRRRDGQIRVQTEQFPDDIVTFEIDDEAPAEPAWS